MYNFPFPASTAWSIYEVSGTIFKSRFYSFICIFITSLQAFILFTKIVVSLVNTHSLYEILVSSTCTCSTYLQYIYLPQLGKFSGSLQVPLYCKHSSTVSWVTRVRRVGLWIRTAWWWNKIPHIQQRHRCSLCSHTAAQRLSLPSCGCDLLLVRDLTSLVGWSPLAVLCKALLTVCIIYSAWSFDGVNLNEWDS